MTTKEAVKITRDIEVVQIPEGFNVRLARGTEVRLMQALGDTYTVMTEYGTMVRVAGKDADAIGKVAAEGVKLPDNPSDSDLEQAVWEQMKTCYDPEIPINIVELGLIYECKVEPTTDGNRKASVKMTLTGMGVIVMVMLARYRFMRMVRVDVVMYAVLVAYSALLTYEFWMLRKLIDPSDVLNL